MVSAESIHGETLLNRDAGLMACIPTTRDPQEAGEILFCRFRRGRNLWTLLRNAQPQPAKGPEFKPFCPTSFLEVTCRPCVPNAIRCPTLDCDKIEEQAGQPSSQMTCICICLCLDCVYLCQ